MVLYLPMDRLLGQAGNKFIRGMRMKDAFLKLSVKVRSLIIREEGQDLIEYALVVALIAFAATAGMHSLANQINAAFNNVGATLNTYTS